MEAATNLHLALLRFRAAANQHLAHQEPLFLVAAPLLALLVARAVHAATAHVADRGLRAVVISLAMAAVKYASLSCSCLSYLFLTSSAQFICLASNLLRARRLVPGVSGYIAAQKSKVNLLTKHPIP